MRSNTRLLAAFLMSILLVNFYSNLGIKVQRLPSERRRLGWEWLVAVGKFFRNLFVAITKAIIGLVIMIVSIEVGIIVFLVVGSLCFVGELIRVVEFEKCPLLKGVIYVIMGLKAGFMEFCDSFRAVADFSDAKDYKYMANHSEEIAVIKEMNAKKRLLSLSKAKPKQPDINANCQQFAKLEVGDVLDQTFENTFTKNREAINLLKRIWEIELQIRADFEARIQNPQIPALGNKNLGEELATAEKKIFALRTDVFQFRVNIAVCGAMASIVKKIETGSDPKNYPPEDKQKYNTLTEELKKPNLSEARSNQLVEQINALNPFNQNDPDKKEAMSKMAMAELEKYNLEEKDLSSQYTLALIRSAAMDFSEKKMGEMKKRMPETLQKKLEFDKADSQLKFVKEAHLENDSMVVANTPEQEDQSEKKTGLIQI